MSNRQVIWQMASAGQSRARQDRRGQDKAGEAKAGQHSTGQSRAVTLQPQQIDMYACTCHTKEAQRALTSGETHMCKQKQTRHLVPITDNQTKNTLSSRLQAQVQHIISKLKLKNTCSCKHCCCSEEKVHHFLSN